MMLLRSVVGLCCVGYVVSFFQMFKGATPQHTADTNAVRGVPEYLHTKYQEEYFVCDGGNTHISKGSINDNYCDCADKTDEPGTSACGSFNSFHCINRGFKMVLLPASRVDDHICDCCDGSDEVFGMCANTCDAAAAKERAALEGATAAYKVGSLARANLIKAVIKEKNEQADRLPTIAAEIDRTNDLVSSVRASVDWAKIKANEGRDNALAASTQVIDGLLQVETLDTSSLARLLSSLISVANWSADQVATAVGAPTASADVHQHHHHHEEEEEHFDEDGYGDEGHGHRHDHDAGEEDAAPAEAVSPCDMVTLSGDDRLQSLCRSEDARSAGESLLKEMLRSQDLHGQFMLLTGFHRTHATFEGSQDFVDQHLDLVRGGSCPALFDPIREHCDLGYKLSDAFQTYNAVHSQESQESEELGSLQVELGQLEERLRGLKSERAAAEGAARDLVDHKDEVELLALKDQCFEVVDGKFSYSVCVLGSISQKEVDGHNTVTLGQYSASEQVAKDASLTLHYTNGQHCHAHGARRADVKVVCGPTNSLKSAVEPSTCFYDLLLESPIACTPQFAALNGIAV